MRARRAAWQPLQSAEELPTHAAELMIIEVIVGADRASYRDEPKETDLRDPEAHATKEAS